MANLLHDLLSQVHDVDESFRRRAGIAWYRGHSVAAWELTSTLHRHAENQLSRIIDPPDYTDHLRAEYVTLYRQFKGDAWPLLNATERTEWGTIFAMQHYGFPTRLLDWTESFACALFFAQLGRKRGDAAAIWILDPEQLNELTIKHHGIVAVDEIVTPTDVKTHPWHPRYRAPKRELPTIAISPIFSNARMTAQRSRFTLSGDSFKPLNKQMHGQLVRDGSLFKVEIPVECFDEADDFLRVTGFKAFSFMPDMEGLRLEHDARNNKTLRDAEEFFPDRIRMSRTQN